MRSRNSDRGFTLVELLVAVVLLATGLVAAATAISAVTRAQASALRRTTAARLAEAKLTEIQAAGITSGTAEGSFAELDTGQMPALGIGGSNFVESAAGQALATSDLGDYYYQWEITSGDFQGLARVQVSVWYRDNEQNPFTLVWYGLSP